ncbi:hypothetical protein M427DRAFT_213390 [Gonapodya prolifera JEL478]|uniref:Zn(2)-C6 fungal-type domain-containing protein n=1 Tax=Gonapodya prolifera (strain JEL478) TaxID=1344416 RepID=A0A138ZZ62_GONPJ|nr:hypothetical protein M427DRAFT_213390 [Gonapodya prolifera JEL478]|eukprot:KXS09780.1 hypothetical protein M427DRAFT_213390 [Gonapodya prolifera JEL478]
MSSGEDRPPTKRQRRSRSSGGSATVPPPLRGVGDDGESDDDVEDGTRADDGTQSGHRSCNICARLHDRCDGKYPCDPCIKRGNECSYERQRVMPGPPKGW